MPDVNEILHEGVNLDATEYHIKFAGEISPTGPKGIARENICVDRENTYSPLPVYTFDASMNAIGPRKRPQ